MRFSGLSPSFAFSSSKSASNIFNGNTAAKRILLSLRNDIDLFAQRWNLSRRPSLGIILVGRNSASISYVTKKQQACEAIGIRHELLHFSEKATEEEIFSAIERLNERDDIDAIIPQLPMPAHISKERVIDLICSTKDADCLKIAAQDLVYSPQNPSSSVLPCTPAACLQVLRESNIDVADKSIVIVGRGRLVGEPLEALLNQMNPRSLTVCVKETENIHHYISKADIIIAAAGQRGLIKGSWVKKGAVILDVGVNKGIPGIDPSPVVGDVEFEEASIRASLITPVPGGIGPLTATMLLRNTVEIWKERSRVFSDHVDRDLEQQISSNISSSQATGSSAVNPVHHHHIPNLRSQLMSYIPVA